MEYTYFILYLICAVYMVYNFRYDLQMFQQNSYRTDRYWRWLSGGNISGAWRLVDVACFFLLFAPQLLITPLAALIVTIVAMVKVFLLSRRKYKKPLVMTKRVWRLYTVMMLLSLGGVGSVAWFTNGATYGIYSGAAITIGLITLINIFSWAIMIASHVILTPVEHRIQQGYINDAKRILASMPDMKVVGITGSYGKTSTKHYLTRILSEEYDVLMTPGSFNTPMGVVRTIREQMKPYNQIFVCEMGAKQRGDIKEICDIVNPTCGIVTAVGPMHLESFKSIENVRDTKFELVDAVPSDGFAVINNDFEQIAGREVTNTRVIRYGISRPECCDYVAKDIRYTPRGTTFKIVSRDGDEMELETKLLGECNVSDLLAAVIMAQELGVSKEKIRYAVASIDQVEHRLSIKRGGMGVTIIDDAFNSNPTGSRMAVEVLSHFTEGKRIIVTPGMIELGEEQYTLNAEFGKHIGKNVDIAIVVGEYNREAIVEGIRSAGMSEDKLHVVDSFNEAQALLGRIMTSGDTVLYENDLPDTFK